MEALVVGCLRCGATRLARRSVWRRFESPECPRCGYLGWEPRLELADSRRADGSVRPRQRQLLRPVA